MVLKWIITYVYLYIFSNTMIIPFVSHNQKLCTWFVEHTYFSWKTFWMFIVLNQMKIIKTCCKLSNNDITIFIKIVETIFWIWLAYGMNMVLNLIHTRICHKLTTYIVSNTITILFGSHTQKLYTWILKHILPFSWKTLWIFMVIRWKLSKLDTKCKIMTSEII